LQHLGREQRQGGRGGGREGYRHRQPWPGRSQRLSRWRGHSARAASRLRAAYRRRSGLAGVGRLRRRLCCGSSASGGTCALARRDRCRRLQLRGPGDRRGRAPSDRGTGEAVAAVVESGLWVNARTDLFLKRLVAGENPNDRALLPEALERAHAFAEAGAHSFFVPGLSDLDIIAEVCSASPLPVNVIKGDAMDLAAIAEAGVARISWGPRPWKWAMDKLTEDAKADYTKL